jgi:hypothetical protein
MTKHLTGIHIILIPPLPRRSACLSSTAGPSSEKPGKKGSSLLAVVFGVGTAILGHLLRLPDVRRQVFRHVLYQLGDRYAEGLSQFIERFQRRIVLRVVPDGLDRFEIDVGEPLQPGHSKTLGLGDLFYSQASHVSLPLAN